MIEKFRQNIGHGDDRQGIVTHDVSTFGVPCYQGGGNCNEEQGEEYVRDEDDELTPGKKTRDGFPAFFAPSTQGGVGSSHRSRQGEGRRTSDHVEVLSG